MPGRLYGAVASGTARQLYLPAVTHPGEHISTEAIGDAADWFARTLKGGTPRGAKDQVWYWKEIGTLTGFIGLVLLMLGVFDVLLELPFFNALAHSAEPARERRDRQWWVALIVGGLIPGLAFLPLMILGSFLLPASALFPQTFTNQVMAWALGALLISYGALYFFRAKPTKTKMQWLPSAAIGLATVGVGYAALLIVDAAYPCVDFRFWVLALKLMSPWQWKSFALYLIPFGAFFFLTLQGLQADLAVRRQARFGALCRDDRGAGRRRGAAIDRRLPADGDAAITCWCAPIPCTPSWRSSSCPYWPSSRCSARSPTAGPIPRCRAR